MKTISEKYSRQLENLAAELADPARYAVASEVQMELFTGAELAYEEAHDGRGHHFSAAIVAELRPERAGAAA